MAKPRRSGALGYDSWQGDPIVMPPRDAVDADACVAIDAAARELRLRAMPADPSDEAHNRAKLAERIAAAEGMTGPNRAAWRGLHLRRLVASSPAMMAPFRAGITGPAYKADLILEERRQREFSKLYEQERRARRAKRRKRQRKAAAARQEDEGHGQHRV